MHYAIAHSSKNPDPYITLPAVALERVIFSTRSGKNKIPPKSVKGPKVSKEDEEDNSDICWWSPPSNWLPVEFCQTTSMHGLGFVGRQKLHLSERIFWLIAFILGVVAAVLLINEVWQNYNANPVIVTFQAQEVDTDSVPFPSITICSMNAFPKSEVKRLQREAWSEDPDTSREAQEALKYVREICHSQPSFAKQFGFAKHRGEDDSELEMNSSITETSKNEMTNFLLKYTLPCEDLLRLCKFAETTQNCSTLFRPVITDYGKCCTFNLLPVPLLLVNLNSKSEANEIHEKALNERWSKEELDLWQVWDYDKQGFQIKNKSQLRPYRQRRAGLPYGLSILVDSNIHDWYCPVSDSQGFRFLLHNPLEIPQVEDFASLIELNKEVLVEIHPEMTTADVDIRSFKMESRHCYFPEERQLQFYGPYTSGNCLSECTSLVFADMCNCTYFYMPRYQNVSICNSDPAASEDFQCVVNAKKTLKSKCKHCEPLCENVNYHFETTMSTLQDSKILWLDPDPGVNKAPDWANNKMSIIHVFMGSETIVPKQRKRLYGVTDLIANTGGLLGLCLGFSVLSAMEVVYFLTLRAFWRFCGRKPSEDIDNHQRLHERNHSEVDYNRRFLNKVAGGGRIVHVNPNQVPLIDKPSHYPFKSPY